MPTGSNNKEVPLVSRPSPEPKAETPADVNVNVPSESLIVPPMMSVAASTPVFPSVTMSPVTVERPIAKFKLYVFVVPKAPHGATTVAAITHFARLCISPTPADGYP